MTRRSHRPRARHDVVFYTPWLGSVLSRHATLPPGGAETQILLLAQALVRRGLRVAIIVFGNSADLPADVQGVTIVARPGYKKPRGLSGRCLEIFYVWRSLWQTPSRTIVYRTAGYELGLIALFARFTRRRMVFSSANVSDFAFHTLEPKRLYEVAYNLGVRLAHAVVVQTEEQIELCEAKFGRRAVLIRSISPLAQSQDGAPLAFLWVGRLVWYKRPLEYVNLARALPEARFWMVGVPSLTTQTTDALVESVKRQSDELPNLELLSARPHSEIEDLISRAVASVNTADFEGMPNTLLEAWSRGVPALVLSHDPDRVVQAHGLGAFAGGSSDRLVALAREQWHGRNDRGELAQRCRRYIQTYHAPGLVAERWARVISATPLPAASGSIVEAEQGVESEQSVEAEQTCAA